MATLKSAARRKPTIYEVLRAKLGREPTNAELKTDVRRILAAVAYADAKRRAGVV